MAPLSCSWISHCPAGSSLPQTTWGAYIGIWILISALLLLWRAALSWLQRRRLQRLQKCRQEVIANRHVAVKDTHAAGCELARWVLHHARSHASFRHVRSMHDSQFCDLWQTTLLLDVP